MYPIAVHGETTGCQCREGCQRVLKPHRCHGNTSECICWSATSLRSLKREGAFCSYVVTDLYQHTGEPDTVRRDRGRRQCTTHRALASARGAFCAMRVLRCLRDRDRLPTSRGRCSVQGPQPLELSREDKRGRRGARSVKPTHFRIWHERAPDKVFHSSSFSITSLAFSGSTVPSSPLRTIWPTNHITLPF